jgi:carbon monoxide dehydrogenase subunit G
MSTEISVNAEYTSSADVVWKELADFGAIGEWAPGLESCKVEGTGVGSVRVLGMAGGMVMRERLESLDERERCLTYAIVGGPLPVENYLATVKVTAQGEGCRVDWGASFDAPEGVPAEGIASGVSGAYSGMLQALKSRVGEG